MDMMEQVQYHQYGGPEVLRIERVPRPVPRAGEVVVRVAAAGVGGGEMDIRQGKMRRILRAAPPFTLGNDFSGTVHAVGDDSSSYSVGQAVWGMTPARTFGSLSEYVSVSEGLLSPAPSTIDLVDAAALPSSGTTAVTALFTQGGLEAGQRLLVRGATGGVGVLAVQLGRDAGAHVTALASASNLDLVRELGADEALDYRLPLPVLEPFDVIVDLVGTHLGQYRRMLRKDGRLVILALDADHLVRSTAYAAWGATLGRRQIRMFSNSPDAAELRHLADLVDGGSLAPVIDRVYDLHDVADAHRAQEAGGLRGKLVVRVGG